MESLENFTAEIEEQLEHVEWLLLTLDYAIFVCLYGGALFTFLLFLSFLGNFASKITNLSNAYFYLLSIGYFVDFLSVIFYTLSIFWFPDIEIILMINDVIQWYAKLFVGFWNTLLVLNRLTAMLWWHRHDRLWSDKFLVIFIGALLLYPIAVNGYSFQNVYCHLDNHAEGCTDYVIQSRHFIAIANGINAVIALIFGLITALSGRLHLTQSKASMKFEKRLLIQAIISSILFGSYCALTAAYSILYPLQNDIKYALAFDVTLDLGNLFYAVFHYSSAVLLVIVSRPVRHRFIKFYHLQYVFKPSLNSSVSQTHVTQFKSG